MREDLGGFKRASGNSNIVLDISTILELLREGIESKRYATPVLRFIRGDQNRMIASGIPVRIGISYYQTAYMVTIVYKDRLITVNTDPLNSVERSLQNWLKEHDKVLRLAFPTKRFVSDNYGEFLTHYRKMLHLNIEEFSKVIRVSIPTASALLSGKKDPTYEETLLVERMLSRNKVITSGKFKELTESLLLRSVKDSIPDDLYKVLERLSYIRSYNREIYREYNVDIKEEYEILKEKNNEA